MKMVKRGFLLISLIVISFLLNIAFADDFPARSNPPRLVNDFASVFTKAQNNTLEQKLVEFNNETSTQIAIVTVSSLNNYSAAEYAYSLGEKWGVGQKGKNNGVLMLIKPKTSDSRGEIFIATGYGVEGAVPDAMAKRIIENEIIPHFRNDNYYGGVSAGVQALIDLTYGEYVAEEDVLTASDYLFAFAFFGFFILIFGFGIYAIYKEVKNKHIGRDLPFWTLQLLMSTHTGSGRSSSGGGFRGGGGGFGGFGGGSFGGGGAGGSW